MGQAAAERPLPSLLPGQILGGKYQIVREIGRGAMGVVHEALHMALGRRVAVKTLLAEIGHDPQLMERFQREARAASAIGHPHIVDVFDLGRTPDGVLFMAMELLNGKSLAALLAETPRLPIPLALDLAGQILGGLGAAHRNRIVHRDLKPDNIFVLDTEDRPNFVKIVDFGISKIVVQSGRAPSGFGRGAGTVAGTIMGTPLYMSPEQLLGEVSRVDHRTDIYATGVVLYEMLCGRTPFEGANHVQVFAAILDGYYPTPRSLRPEIPPDVEAAIVCALNRNMDKRFETAAAMREALTGRSAELTPPPELIPVSFGEALPTSFGEAVPPSSTPVHVQGDGRIPSLIWLKEEPAPAPKPARLLPPSAMPGGDPMQPAAEPALEMARLSRGRSVVRQRPTMAPAPAKPSRGVSRLWLALAAAALIVVAPFAYRHLRPAGNKAAPAAHRELYRVTLAVDPATASVQIDQGPATRDDLPLEPGTTHVVHAAAPGRITRNFSFEAKADQGLLIRLGRTLPLPSPAEPDPSPSELAVGYSPDPPPRESIDHAFAKLDRYARCLALLGYAEGDTRKGGNPAGPSNSTMSACVQLLDEANTLAPPMFQLHTTGAAYLQAVHGGQSPAALRKLLAAFRAEFLAVRFDWQMSELSRQGTDDGQTAAWHLRRVALAAQAWVRQSRVPSAAARAAKDGQTKFDESYQALLEFAEHSPKAMAQVSGADEFMNAAQELVALTRNEPDKRHDVVVAFAACRRLLAAFNVLVVE